ncbi:phosphotransferase enzyme family protein [Cohnella sp. REN36]|uniref:phosphotransferase enzyme family protein n=1 Tax=Cohnella sp. REN36 TaxID=2887347 RepID=UPI001D13B1BB|nr:phosphotransferase [Cohnella sp. REN36]MCC3376279.1 phosphotransferase [Cohnella sp. REN36]
MMTLTNMVRGREGDVPARLLLQRWAHDADTLSFWRASSNFVYTFSRRGERHFLRFIHEDDNRPERIEAELRFVSYLIGQGYPAAAPVRSEEGRLIETVSTDSGQYYGVVFEHARGQSLPADRMSEEHCAAWGRSLAELHRLAEAYVEESPMRRGWEDTLIWASSILLRDPRDEELLPALHALRIRLSELPAGPGVTGMIHYDFEWDNLRYIPEEGRFAVYDFDDAMTHWFAMDVASALSDLQDQRDDRTGGLQGSFVEGYRSVRALGEDELDLFPVFRQYADFYRYARIVRSIRDFDPAGAPEWAVSLHAKLQQACGPIRERLRSR